MAVEEDQSTQPQSSESGQKTGIDYNHPLFLSPADVSGTQIISFQLTGVENYSIWYRSMRVALLGRNKLGMVDGSCKKKVFPEQMWSHWERVNAVVLSWLMNSVEKGLLGGIMYASHAQEVWDDLYERFNKIDGSRTFNLHKEIATLSQGTATVSAYFSKLKNLWEEFEALVPSPSCNCEKSKEFIVHLQKLKLFQFLMGLNDSYNQARSQILLMSHMPSVNQAYGMVISDEGQKSVAANSGILGASPASSGSNLDMAMFTRNGSTRYKKNYNMQCEFCKMKGHTKEVCYKLVGYPSDFNKFRKKGAHAGGSDYHPNARAHNVVTGQLQYSEQWDNGSTRYKKNYNMQCEFCKMKGHTKEVCYKLVGYPSDFNKFRKKGAHAGGSDYHPNARAHNVVTGQLQYSEQWDMMGDLFENMAEGNKADYKGKGVAYKAESSSQNRESEMGVYPFTKEQYSQIVSLLKNMSDNNTSANSSANLAGSLQWNGEGDW